MSEALNTTPLFQAHQDCGATLIDFAGWNMPLRYGSQKNEHLSVRQQAGMFDVSHMLAVDVTGRDARTLARKLLSNDVDKINKPCGAMYGCLLNDQGGVVDDTIWWKLDENHFLVVLNASCRETDLAWIQYRADGMQVAIAPRYNHGILAVQGPQARRLVTEAIPEYANDQLSPMQARIDGQRVISRTGYSGEDGLELILPASDMEPAWKALLEAGVAPCGLGARDSLRLEAGMMLYGNELSPHINPFEVGIGWCVNFSDPQRQFIGRKALESKQHSSSNRRLVGLVLEKGVLRAGHKVCMPSGESVGAITSGGFSFCIGSSIALALLQPDTRTPSDGHLAVEIREQLHPVKVVAPVFVRKGKVLIS